MRRGIVLVAVCVTLFGAGCSLNKQFVTAVDKYANTYVPEYKKYIESDSSLDAESKRIRLQSADKFLETISNAVKEVED